MVRDESGGPLEGLGKVGRPSPRSGTGWGTPRRSLTVRETLLKVWDWSEEALGGPGRVGRSSRGSETGRVTRLGV